LAINKDLLHKHINESNKIKSENQILSEMNEENIRLQKKIEKLFNENNLLDKKVYKVQQCYEDRMAADRELLDNLSDKIFQLENKLIAKDNIIDDLKQELSKYLNADNLKKTKHIFVVDPTKVNVDLNNELNFTRDILAKLGKLMNVDKNKIDKLEHKITYLNDEIKQSKSMNNLSLNDVKVETIKSSEGNSQELEEEDEDEEEEEQALSSDDLPSPDVKFPDKTKINYNSNNNKIKIIKPIPKLDFTKVKEKYKSNVVKQTNNTLDKSSDIKSVNAESENCYEYNNNSNKKLKKELKQAYQIIDNLRKKIDKLKQLYKDKKKQIMQYNNALKLAKHRLEILEKSSKKQRTSGAPTTEDTNNRGKVHNTSINNNTSLREDLKENEENYIVDSSLKQKQKAIKNK